jgi:Insertion element 4 transposase N-terminal/Transposase DDE domain
MILPPKPRAPVPPDPVVFLLVRLRGACQPTLRIAPVGVGNAPAPPDPARLFPSLYLLLPLEAILAVLEYTDTASKRQRRLPAHEVVWLVIGQSWFPDRSIPKVWRHLHPSPDDRDPVDSAFTQARQRLGARPLQLLFHRTCRPLSAPDSLGAFHKGWLIVALDGSVFEAPDTPSNRKVLGSASNQHSEGAFPQLRLSAICEVGTHVVTDVEMGPYNASEQALSLRMLRRLPSRRLVLMDRGLSYYELIHAVRQRNSHVLARVKAKQRDLPVEKVLPDGSYLSTIYPSSNAKRAKRGGIRVRVIRYTHDDLTRDGCGEESCLITTMLSVETLSAREAVRVYPWRWEEESVFSEIKKTMLQNKQPLLRSKEPALVVQEMYGLLVGHYVVRKVMAQAAGQRGVAVEAVRLSFKNSLEVLEDRLKDPADADWLKKLQREVGWQKLRPKRARKYPRVKKATRSRWPAKKPGTKPPPQPTKHLFEIIRIMQTDGH